MVTSQDLLNALARVMDTTREHDRQHEEHVASGAYSWDYYGASLIHERDLARKDFSERLDAYIDARVRNALSELLGDSNSTGHNGDAG